MVAICFPKNDNSYACVVHMVVGLCQWVGSSPFSCRWFGFAGWHWQPIMVPRVRVSAYSPSGREVLRAVAQ